MIQHDVGPFRSCSRLLVSHLNLEIYHSVFEISFIDNLLPCFFLLSLYGTVISQMLELVSGLPIFLVFNFPSLSYCSTFCVIFCNFIFQPLCIIFNSQYLIVIISNSLLLSSSLFFSYF